MSENGRQSSQRRSDILPGSGYICQFLCMGWQPKRMEQMTATYVTPMKTYARCRRVFMFINPELNKGPTLALIIPGNADTHVNRE